MSLDIWHYSLQKEGIKYELRQPPLWMRQNLHDGNCWCGKPKELWEKFQRKYCSRKHANWWFYHIRCYWNAFRIEIYNRDDYTCQECGFKIKQSERDYSHASWEVDHIKAICLGGMCYDIENVRTLCQKCHRLKTTKDIRKLTLKKKKQEVLIPL